jgi:hypothetical protein
MTFHMHLLLRVDRRADEAIHNDEQVREAQSTPK